MIKLALGEQGLFDGLGIDTPILSMNTNDDPVSPLHDMEMMLARATNSEVAVWDLPGHCMPHNQRQAIASAWVVKHLR